MVQVLCRDSKETGGDWSVGGSRDPSASLAGITVLKFGSKGSEALRREGDLKQSRVVVEGPMVNQREIPQPGGRKWQSGVG